MMNVDDAKKEIAKFFNNYGASINPLRLAASKGKTYELFCVAKTVEYLANLPNVSVKFVGWNVDFKASAGKVDKSKSHFIVSGNGKRFELFTDIEVKTLSFAYGMGVTGKSSYHEIDLVLLENAMDGQRPSHNQVILGIECKAHDPFKKGIVRQVLGTRRELSLFDPQRQSSLSVLGKQGCVNAYPPSEFWLAFSDPSGMSYGSGPEVFSIEFKHWCP